jgi:hypothetical protein
MLSCKTAGIVVLFYPSSKTEISETLFSSPVILAIPKGVLKYAVSII